MADAVVTTRPASGGGGGGEILDALGTGASLDGIFSFKEGSAATATADYGKVYSKAKAATASSAELLFQFQDDLDDAKGAYDGTGAGSVGVTYAASGAGGAYPVGFGKCGVFDNSGGASDAYFTWGDVDIGNSDFTVEFWFNLDSLSNNSAFFNQVNTGYGEGSLAIGFGSNNITLYIGKSGGYDTYQVDVSDLGEPGWIKGDNWHYLAAVKDAGYFRLYIGSAGDTLAYHRTKSVSDATNPATTYVVGGQGEDWQIGRFRDGSVGWAMQGKMDEFMITKSAKYSGFSIPLPKRPYTVAETSEIYGINSEGTETELV